LKIHQTNPNLGKETLNNKQQTTNHNKQYILVTQSQQQKNTQQRHQRQQEVNNHQGQPKDVELLCMVQQVHDRNWS
jgi:hypothetical protein